MAAPKGKGGGAREETTRTAAASSHLVFQGIEEFGFYDSLETGFAQISADQVHKKTLTVDPTAVASE